MSQRLVIGNVVDGDDLDIGFLHLGAEDIPADTAEAVDRNFHSHAGEFSCLLEEGGKLPDY